MHARRQSICTLLTPLLAAAALSLAGCVVHVSESQDTIDITDPYDAIVVDADSGDVDVHLASGGDTSVSSTTEWTHDCEPAVDAYVSGGTLYVIVDCPDDGGWWFVHARCVANVEVAASDPVDVDLWSGAGDLSVQDMAWVTTDTDAGDVHVSGASGDVCVETSAGDIDVDHVVGNASLWSMAGDVTTDGVRGDVDVETAAGDIDASGIGGARADLRTDAGDVEADMVGPFESVSLSTAAGDVHLEVPRGTYDLDLHTSVGDVDMTGVSDDPDASSAITARTDAGDIRVLGR
jgi:hypothetical protein